MVLDALLAHLDATTSHLARRPVLLTDPDVAPGGDPPRPPPPPYGSVPGGDLEELYSSVQKPRPPRVPPDLGDLERLLRDLSVTQSSLADELLEGPKKKEAPEEAEVKRSPPPPRSGTSSATSATQELDKLMASLSDFHLQRSVPPKKVVPEEKNLEAMLELLQEDLSRQGVPTGSKGVCGACHKPIAGKAVRALGLAWHPEHFSCGRCGVDLAGGGGFCEKDGVLYCPRDYGSLFSPRCALCAQPILGRMVTALEKTWHPEHFCCVKCGKPFGEEGFLEREGRPFCREDFSELFSSRCRACGGPVLDTFVSALDGLWHPDCFVCSECLQPFPGGTFFEAGGRPFCELHFSRRSHPPAAPFACTFCLGALAEGTFQEMEGKPYCRPCFQRLFA
ncbi:transforming growth factor beta-1-induced transcript 1 protein isoform X2 [Phaenicophaeus curvirostris]|uniref:transforming growth factor beta-1-induced transcript 1 protein isoform X2 n=1 Tax=Phaenicophaeus curvirostris TaxID=33595 RepID=UPI0037F0A825